jgi:hypothetical protein
MLMVDRPLKPGGMIRLNLSMQINELAPASPFQYNFVLCFNQYSIVVWLWGLTTWSFDPKTNWFSIVVSSSSFKIDLLFPPHHDITIHNTKNP